MSEPIPSLMSRIQPALKTRAVYQQGALFFVLTLIIFLGFAVVSAGLGVYKRSLDGTKKQWESKIENQKKQLQVNTIDRLFAISDELTATRELLSSHVYTSNVFAFLQEVTHPQVQFLSFTFSRDAKKIDLTAAASSYRTVAEQISFLEGHPQVEQVDFGGLTSGDKGLVNFNLAIIFKPSLLKIRSQ